MQRLLTGTYPDQGKVFIGADAVTILRRTARSTRLEWSTYRRGRPCAARATATTLKIAMLAVGTQGQIRLYTAGESFSSLMGWGEAAQLLKNMKYWDKNPLYKPKEYC